MVGHDGTSAHILQVFRHIGAEDAGNEEASCDQGLAGVLIEPYIWECRRVLQWNHIEVQVPIGLGWT